MAIGVALGMATYTFSSAEGYWRWVKRCDEAGVDSLWQTDRLVSKEPFLECMSVMAGLAGATKSVSDAFVVPGNATVIDAWLHVDESGYLENGSGLTWSGDDVPSNFSAGQFTDTMIGKFDGAMSLTPDSAVSNVDTFSSATLQLPSSWSNSGSIWEAVNPTGLGGEEAVAHATLLLEDSPSS